MRTGIKILTRLFLWVLGVVIAIWLGSEIIVIVSASGRCYGRLVDIPKRDTGLVLGTSKYVAPGRLNKHYEYRIDAAAKLFKAGKVHRLIVSGNGAEPNYSEPRMMREDLIARGVPADRIVMDEAGMRTFDSIVRAADIYGAPDCIVISQRAHNQRAIFIARTRGYDMIAFNARSVGIFDDLKTLIREHLARVLAVLDVTILHQKPQLAAMRNPLSVGVSNR
jgi:SanA protein